MLVDLCKERNRDSGKMAIEMNRQDRQIESRAWRTQCSRDEILGLPIDPEYQRLLLDLLQGRRNYEVSKQWRKDNMIELELQGIGDSCNTYTVVVDFGGCLDYLLHRICRCDPVAIRTLHNYEHFSKALLECNLTAEDGTFERLMSLSPELDAFFVALFEECEREVLLRGTYNTGELTKRFFMKFFSVLNDELATLRKCVVGFLRGEYADTGLVYRSKTPTLAVLTASEPINEELTLIADGVESCIVSVKSYKRFEYALKNHPRKEMVS